jgi:rubrerythrin
LEATFVPSNLPLLAAGQVLCILESRKIPQDAVLDRRSVTVDLRYDIVAPRTSTDKKGVRKVATQENLADAFAGESQANRRYLAFAERANADGYPHVAKLFRAAAAAETVHALTHLRAMGGVNSTAENLQAAAGGEAFEFQQMYPPYLQQAQEEGNRPAEYSFKNALAVEEIHHGLYEEAVAAVAGGQDLPDRKVYVCGICGNTVYDHAPDRCPVCHAPRERFTEID